MQSTELVMSQRPRDGSTGETGETSRDSNDFSNSVDEMLGSLESQLSESTGAIRVVLRPLEFVLNSANLASLHLQNDGTNKQMRSRYRRSMLLLSSITVRLRINDQILAQEIADRIEMWLVTELEKPNRSEILRSDNYRDIVQALANHDSRYQARRRAVVASLNETNFSDDAGNVNGLPWPNIQSSSIATSWLVADRNKGLATMTLLRHLEQGSMPELSGLPVELREYWQTVSKSNAAERAAQIELFPIQMPGLFWHQDWEDRAQRLAESIE